MDSLFVRAALGKTQEKPVWMMRQAGRYLPEYRSLREKFPDFISFVRNVDAAAEATLQPVRRFDLDAAILFSDILVTLPPMGFDLAFLPGKGPVVRNPLRAASDIGRLRKVNLLQDLDFTGKALKKIRATLSSEKALLGFVGGPLTIASYAIEGGSSKDLHRTKALFYNDPDTFDRFLSAVANVTGEYLAQQAEWGADALVIMDSWAGHLSSADYYPMAGKFTRRVVEIVRSRSRAPIIHYANGASHLLPFFTALNVDVVGVDHRVELSEIFDKYPDTVFQGNLDPAKLFASPEAVSQSVSEILKTVQSRPHIMNLGHGVLPETPVESVRAFVDTVRGNFRQ